MKGKVYVKVRPGDLIKYTPFEFEDGSSVTKVEDVIYRGRYQYVTHIMPGIGGDSVEVLLHDLCDIYEIL